MRLTSTAFSEGQSIPRRYTCDGDDLSPALHWTGAPAQTKSFALLCDDPDAPSGTWRHWAAYDIPAGRTDLAEGAGNSSAPDHFKQALNDFQLMGYGGPCPPHRHGTHHYHFRLLALSCSDLPVGAKPSCKDIEREARKHTLAEAALMGVYQR
jgi:Raf kinase inhibitor-like YbhB/YbcL family protein